MRGPHGWLDSGELAWRVLEDEKGLGWMEMDRLGAGWRLWRAGFRRGGVDGSYTERFIIAVIRGKLNPSRTEHRNHHDSQAP